MTFTLPQGWVDLTLELGLPSVKHTYVIWLWMEHTLNSTYLLSASGGTVMTSEISRIGSLAMSRLINEMRYEVPLTTIAQQMALNAEGNSCEYIYMEGFEFSKLEADTLCTYS